MAYPPNTKRWQRGALVIHAGDYKGDARMLMRVTGYEKSGLVRTRYVKPTDRNMRGVCLNKLESLLDPADFGIDTKQITEAQVEDKREWIDIDPNFAFVTTLISDNLHIRRKADAPTHMLCGREMKADDIADYPAKAMPTDELCGSCVRVYKSNVAE